jgi:hypothetical protein
MYVDHIVANLNYLSFKPLVNSILDINPLSNFVPGLIEIERGNGFTRNDLLFLELILAVLEKLDGGDILVKRFERFGNIEMWDLFKIINTSPSSSSTIRSNYGYFNKTVYSIFIVNLTTVITVVIDVDVVIGDLRIGFLERFRY